MNTSSLVPLQHETDFIQALKTFSLTAQQAPEDSRSLEAIVNTAAKHLPAYLKIVKGHLDQLANVLKLDSHQNQTLQDDRLAEPLQQLARLFQDLNEEDLNHIEWLSRETQQWRKVETAAEDQAISPLTQEA